MECNVRDWGGSGCDVACGCRFFVRVCTQTNSNTIDGGGVVECCRLQLDCLHKATVKW